MSMLLSLAIVTPYAQQAKLEIRSIELARQSLPCFAPLDVDVKLGATYDNPFDPDDVTLDAIVRPAKGDSYTVPGYLDRPFTRKQVGGKEVCEPAGPPRWRLRLAALSPGDQKVEVRLHDRTGTVSKAFT